MATIGQPGGIAAGAGTDFGDTRWRRRQEMSDGREDILRGDGLERGDQYLRVLGISCDCSFLQ